MGGRMTVLGRLAVITTALRALPGIGAWGGARLRVAQFLANLWQGPRRLPCSPG